MITKLVNFVKTYQSEIVLVIGIILITVSSYNLGKLSVLNQSKTPSTGIALGEIGEAQTKQSIRTPKPSPTPHNTANEPVVASKKSSNKVYHFSWCSGASKITEKNKMTFVNETAAIAAGYTLAGNCTK